MSFQPSPISTPSAAPASHTIIASGGKHPPYSLELEQSVLGIILVQSSLFETIREYLKDKVEFFYIRKHQYIYQAILTLYEKKEEIDIISVGNELEKMKARELVPQEYLVELTFKVGLVGHIETHARLLLDKFIQRELIRICAEVSHKAYEHSLEAEFLINYTEEQVFAISNLFLRKHYDKISSVLTDTMERIELLRQQKDGLTGVPSGFHELDKLTGGWQPTDLIILAARPAMGKTALALNFALNAVLHPKYAAPVAIFTLEMSSSQLVQRFLSMRSEIPLAKITRGDMSDEELGRLKERGVVPLSELPVFIDDTPALNLFELRAKCRRLVAQEKVKLVLVDYLQLIISSEKTNANREQQISKISRDLKALAKELNIPIIALSQLNRAVETRGGDGQGKIPQLSDLRESGAIEQDADMVAFLYRPEYYQNHSESMGSIEKGIEGYSEIKIAKHRNGKLGSVPLVFRAVCQKFTPFDSPHLLAASNAPSVRMSSKMNEFSSSAIASEEDGTDETIPF